jgi:hypothetical protein
MKPGPPARVEVAVSRSMNPPSRREASMRDWLMLAAPLLVVLYFLILPSQFHAVVAWATQ